LVHVLIHWEVYRLAEGHYFQAVFAMVYYTSLYYLHCDISCTTST